MVPSVGSTRSVPPERLSRCSVGAECSFCNICRYKLLQTPDPMPTLTCASHLMYVLRYPTRRKRHALPFRRDVKAFETQRSGIWSTQGFFVADLAA